MIWYFEVKHILKIVLANDSSDQGQFFSFEQMPFLQLLNLRIDSHTETSLTLHTTQTCFDNNNMQE